MHAKCQTLPPESASWHTARINKRQAFRARELSGQSPISQASTSFAVMLNQRCFHEHSPWPVKSVVEGLSRLVASLSGSQAMIELQGFQRSASSINLRRRLVHSVVQTSQDARQRAALLKLVCQDQAGALRAADRLQGQRRLAIPVVRFRPAVRAYYVGLLQPSMASTGGRSTRTDRAWHRGWSLITIISTSWRNSSLRNKS